MQWCMSSDDVTYTLQHALNNHTAASSSLHSLRRRKKLNLAITNKVYTQTIQVRDLNNGIKGICRMLQRENSLGFHRTRKLKYSMDCAMPCSFIFSHCLCFVKFIVYVCRKLAKYDILYGCRVSVFSYFYFYLLVYHFNLTEI